MGTIHKNVTQAVLAANQANSASSSGPASDTGKEESKMNAFKNGKYARRPDPVELLRNDHSEEEEAERDQLRADTVRCYQPPDDFACRQAEELADLQFELRRVERAKQVMLARERELLALEQRKCASRLKAKGAAQARTKEIYRRGLASQADSPGKFREMLEVLEWLVRQESVASDFHLFLDRLYGDSWRGVRLNRALSRAEESESDEDGDRAAEDFEREARQEIEQVRDELAICELEQGTLSPAGEAARLLEAMGSRKWSWIRQHEMFLRRSMDGKVRALIDLRREANRAERRAAGQDGVDAASGPSSGGDGNGGPVQSDQTSGGGMSSAVAVASVDTAEPGEAQSQSEVSRGAEPTTSSMAGAPEMAPVAGSQSGGLELTKQGRNQGTKPLSPVLSVEDWQQAADRVLPKRDRSQAWAAPDPSVGAVDSVWSPVSRS